MEQYTAAAEVHAYAPSLLGFCQGILSPDLWPDVQWSFAINANTPPRLVRAMIAKRWDMNTAVTNTRSLYSCSTTKLLVELIDAGFRWWESGLVFTFPWVKSLNMWDALVVTGDYQFGPARDLVVVHNLRDMIYDKIVNDWGLQLDRVATLLADMDPVVVNTVTVFASVRRRIVTTFANKSTTARAALLLFDDLVAKTEMLRAAANRYTV
jgi:hypothetical protein